MMSGVVNEPGACKVLSRSQTQRCLLTQEEGVNYFLKQCLGG